MLRNFCDVLLNLPLQIVASETGACALGAAIFAAPSPRNLPEHPISQQKYVIWSENHQPLAAANNFLL